MAPGGRNATLQQARDPAGWVSAPTKRGGVAWDQGTVRVTLKKPFCLHPAMGNPSGFAVEWRADPRGAPSPPSPSESSSRVRVGTGGAELSPLRAARGAGGAVSARGFFTSCRPWPPSPLLGAGGCSEPQAGARGDSRAHFLLFFPSIWHLNVDEGEEQSELGQSEATQPDACSRRRRQEPAASAAGGGSRQQAALSRPASCCCHLALLQPWIYALAPAPSPLFSEILILFSIFFFFFGE